MRILITAFEPFGGKAKNASGEVLRLLPEQFVGHSAVKILLPVIFQQAADRVLSQPADIIFLLGEAGGRETVTPETTARNFRSARIPDNAGRQPQPQQILPDGPETIRTRIPAESIVEQMRSEGLPIALSHDAGAYVCNETFFLTSAGTNVPVDFIHVPANPEKAGEYADIVSRFILLAVQKTVF